MAFRPDHFLVGSLLALQHGIAAFDSTRLDVLAITIAQQVARSQRR
jgi:hypothetical protein